MNSDHPCCDNCPHYRYREGCTALDTAFECHVSPTVVGTLPQNICAHHPFLASQLVIKPFRWFRSKKGPCGPFLDYLERVAPLMELLREREHADE